MNRCPWLTNNEIYLRYHDEEWGTPVHDDHRLFEFFVLESAQAGLSWSTILMKRDHYRKAYNQFDPVKVSKYNDSKIERLLSHANIVRNRRKVEASIHNARCFIAIQREFCSFDQYLWGFVHDKPIINHWKKISEIPTKTPLSDLISKDLRKRGFRFVGPTIIYAYLQAIGVVNDHIVTCFRYKELCYKSS
jgi:DNA-3-methyladenine glycosylase I